MKEDVTHTYLTPDTMKRAEIVLDSIEEALFELDEFFVFKYINKKAADFWRKDRNELLGKNIWEEFPQAKGTRPFNAIEKAVREK